MSNRLPTLAAEVHDLHAEVARLEGEATARALEAGAKLAEAKQLVGHGGWGTWLAEAGIPARSASRYMALHRAGFDIGHVADLGGIASAAAWAGGLRLPGEAEALAVVGEVDSASCLGMVWCGDEGHHAGACVLRPVEPYVEVTRRPVLAEFAVWRFLWMTLGSLNGLRPPEMIARSPELIAIFCEARGDT